MGKKWEDFFTQYADDAHRLADTSAWPTLVVRVTSVKSVLRESHNITSRASQDTNNNPRKCPKTNCHSSGSNTTMKCEGLFNYTNYSGKTFQTSFYRTQLVNGLASGDLATDLESLCESGEWAAD